MATRLKEYLEKRSDLASSLADAVADIVAKDAAFQEAKSGSAEEREALAERNNAGGELLELIERITGKSITVEEGVE